MYHNPWIVKSFHVEITTVLSVFLCLVWTNHQDTLVPRVFDCGKSGSSTMAWLEGKCRGNPRKPLGKP